MDQQVTAQINHLVTSLSVCKETLKFKAAGTLPLDKGVFARNRIIPDPVQAGWLYPIYYHQTLDKMDDYSHLVRLSPGNLDFVEEIKPEEWEDGFVQASIVNLDDAKHLKAFFRDRGKKHIFSSESFDGGRTWSSMEENELINNNAGIHCTKLSNGALLMVYNPLHRRRYHLSVAVSFDEGKTWPLVKDLECDSCDVASSSNDSDLEDLHAFGDDHGPEFSYPSAFESKADGRIHITYTWSRATANMLHHDSPGLRDTIKHVIVTMDYLGINDYEEDDESSSS